MKGISLFFISIILLNQIKSDCNQRTLKYYGLEGVQIPMEYNPESEETNYCPHTKQTCCSNDDYEKTRMLWNEKAKSIKGYLLKMMNIIEKSSSMQSSLTNLANRVRGKNSEFCSKVNFTYFVEKVRFEEIYFYTKSAMQVFAELQKGFYCSICDYEQNKFLGVMREGEFYNVMSVGFCSKLIELFREFLIYKVYYIDPMIINSNFLFNCYEDSNKYKLDFNYNTTLDEISSCIESDGMATDDCLKLCQEFKIGEASDMFIGSLQQYDNFINNLQNIMRNFDKSYDEDDLHINEDEDFNNKFFLTQESNDPLLKHADLSNNTLLIEGFGFDLYVSALNSKYGLNGELESITQENFGDNTTIDHTNTDEIVTEAEFNDPNEVLKFEEAHEQEKLEEVPNKPDKIELENKDQFIKNKELELQDSIRENGEIGGEPGTINEFGIAKIENKSYISVVFLGILLLFV